MDNSEILCFDGAIAIVHSRRMQTKTGEMMHNITTQVGQIKWSKWATPELRTLKKQYIGLEMDQVRQMKQLAGREQLGGSN